MKQRCHNNKMKDMRTRLSYIDKGIIVCDEWRNDFNSFEQWAISNGYKEDLTIDRIDSNGNYEPSNCRWISKSENSKKACDERKKNLTEAIQNLDVERIGKRRGIFKVVHVVYKDSEKIVYSIVRTHLIKHDANIMLSDLLRKNQNHWGISDYRILKMCVDDKEGQLVLEKTNGEKTILMEEK